MERGPPGKKPPASEVVAPQCQISDRQHRAQDYAAKDDMIFRQQRHGHSHSGIKMTILMLVLLMIVIAVVLEIIIEQKLSAQGPALDSYHCGNGTA
jgi:hypothetical protein